MKYLSLLGSALMLFSASCNAGIKNAAKRTVHVYGNCNMCKEVIETSGTQKNRFSTVWDKDTKQAVITYDSTGTKVDEVLKRIALAGYDNEMYLAPAEAYDQLPECCHYERKMSVKEIAQDTAKKAKTDTAAVADKANTAASAQPFSQIYDNYFLLKDALVGSDAKLAAAKSALLLEAINAVDMSKLKSEDHMVWMKVMTALKKQSSDIAASGDLEKQRAAFAVLSESMYTLMKQAGSAGTVYFQHCPMYHDGKGGNWLSRENTVKNPFYGKMMLNCGEIKETIKK